MEIEDEVTIRDLQKQQLDMSKQISDLLATLSQKTVASSRSSVEKPEPFKGKTDDSRRFLRYFTNWAIHQTNLQNNTGGRDDRRWISSALSFFTGDAYGWASRFLQEIVDAEIASSSNDAAQIARSPFPFESKWQKFIESFEKHFQPNDDKKSALLELDNLKQGTDRQSAHKLCTKFQEIFPRTGLGEQDGIVRLTAKLHRDDQMWLLMNQLGNAKEPTTLDELVGRIINNEFTMRTRPGQMNQHSSSNTTPASATSIPADPMAMQVDASRTPHRSLNDFREVMKGRCYGCGQRGHVKTACRFKETQCNYCKRKGHIQGACQDRFMGLEQNRGLRKPQQVRATIEEAPFDACAAFNSPATATISAATSAPTFTPPVTSSSTAVPMDLQTYQQNQLRLLEQISQLQKGF